MKTNWDIVERVKCVLHDRKIHLTTVQIELEEVKEDSCEEEFAEETKKPCYTNINFTTISLDDEFDFDVKNNI